MSTWPPWLDFPRWLPGYVISAVFLGVLLVCAELGYRAGRRMRARGRGEQDSELGTLQAAMLGLLALLLGFTYSFVATRADNRRLAVIDEANAIGTAYLRAALAPEGAALRGTLREYIASRIVTGEITRDSGHLEAAIARSTAILDRLWPELQRIMADRAGTPIDALLVASVNEVIDMHTRRLGAGRDVLPSFILLMLTVVAGFSLGMIGHAAGRTGTRKPVLIAVLALLLTAVVFVIIDLDRPQSGLMRVSQQPLVDTARSMQVTIDPAR